MTDNTENISRGEAQEALESAAKMEGAGWRRAVPDRWLGAGFATLIGGLFALYALEDPYPYIVFPILGIGLLTAVSMASREKTGAHGRDFPDSKANKWALLLFCIVTVVVFFGSIVIRRTYDAAWVPLVVGALVGVVVYWLSELARRAHIARADKEQCK